MGSYITMKDMHVVFNYESIIEPESLESELVGSEVQKLWRRPNSGGGGMLHQMGRRGPVSHVVLTQSIHLKSLNIKDPSMGARSSGRRSLATA